MISRLQHGTVIFAMALFLLGAGSVTAQEGVAPQGQEQAQGHGGEALSTMEMEDKDFFQLQYEHSVPHVVYDFGTFSIYNVNLFQWLTLGLILLIFVPVRLSFTSGRAGPITRIFRGWVHWIRDEMIKPVMGREDATQFAPFFFFLFFFIALMNTLGLVPHYGLFPSYTATSTPYVTGAMAAVILFMMLFFGMKKQGVVKFWVNLLPPGLPKWLIPLMFAVELIGLFVKPFALMIRLFANMLAGHLVIASLIGMIFLFAKMMEMSPLAYATVVPALGMAVFVYIIEGLIVLLQAYIFAFLSIMFIHQAMHPAH